MSSTSLIQKEENVKMSLTEAQQELLEPVFESQMPKDDKIHYNISFEAMSPDEAPVVITQNEFMRRMKEMAAMGGGGMSQFYGQMPDNFTIAVNGNHPIVNRHSRRRGESLWRQAPTVTKKIDAAVAEEKRFDEVVKGKKEEELTPRRSLPARNCRRRSSPCATSATSVCARSAAKPPRQADHRPGPAHERHAERQESHGFIQRSISLIEK